MITLLLVLPSCDYISQKLHFGKYSLKAAIEWAKADSARVADSLKRIMPDKKVIERTLPDSMKKALSQKRLFEKILTDSLMSIDDNNPHEGDTAPRFYIITGSFANHANALNESGKYSGLGFKTTILTAYGNDGSRLELVSVKSFSDYNKAREFLKGFNGIYDLEAWIYSGK
jgi:hypothetical protein